MPRFSSVVLVATSLAIGVALGSSALAKPLDHNKPRIPVECPANATAPDFTTPDGWRGSVIAFGNLSASYRQATNEIECAYGELRPNGGGPQNHYVLRKAVPPGLTECAGDGRFNDRIFCTRP